jgi:hypothetical protein
MVVPISILTVPVFGLSAVTQKVQVVAKARDYRDANANWPVKKQYEEPLGQASVDSDTDVVFQTAGTSKVQHFGLLDVLTLSLSS